MYGVIYITMGNLSENCVAFGTYALQAAGINEGHDSTVRGLAVVCMTATCLVHAISMQGGIYIIIVLAIFKVCILLAIIGIGFAALGGKTYGYGTVHGETITNSITQTGPANLDLHSSFAHSKRNSMQSRHGHRDFWRSVWRTLSSTRDVGNYSILNTWEPRRHGVHGLAR